MENNKVTYDELKNGLVANGLITNDSEEAAERKVNNAWQNIVCGKMWIKDCCIDEKGNYSYVINFINICGKEISIVVPRAKFKAAYLSKLINEKGGYVYDDRLLYMYLKQYESYVLGYEKPANEKIVETPLVFKNTYSKAGWRFMDDDKVAFVSSEGCYSEKKYIGDIEYTGKLCIEQKGTVDNYKKMIQKYMIEDKNIPLQAVLSMSTASVLLWYFNNVLHKQILNFIVHLCGERGSGKTTSLELCASFSGKPVPQSDAEKTSIYSTFNGTDNALIELDFNNGYAIAIDDTQLCDNKIKDSFFYALASGKGRQRLKSNGSRANVKSEYTTGILTSGEKDLFSALTENGLKPRIIELDGVKWTDDSKISDDIKNIVCENYGLISPLIAQYVIDNLEFNVNDKLSEAFSKWEDRFLSEARDKHYYIHDTPRFVKTLALFMVGLEVLEKTLEQKYDVEGVYHFFFDSVVVKKAQNEQSSFNIYSQLVDYNVIHGNEVAVMQKTENGVEGTIPFEDDENTSELIKNTCKIASRYNGSKYSIFIPTAEAFYILQEELGVKDFEKFLQDMLESKRLVWTETTSRAGKKVPRLDTKYHNKRGYRFILPDNFMERVKEYKLNKD